MRTPELRKLHTSASYSPRFPGGPTILAPSVLLCDDFALSSSISKLGICPNQVMEGKGGFVRHYGS